MTTNGRTNPLGISGENVSFSWASATEERDMIQQGYRLRVGTTEGGAEVWDSGQVVSERQIDVVLPTSIRIQPSTRYHWQVKIRDQRGNESGWSAPAWFETGLLSEADWAGAEWIGQGKAGDAGWGDCTVVTEFTLRRDAFGVFLHVSPDGRNGYMYQVNVAGELPLLKSHKRVNGTYEEMARIDLSRLGFTKARLLQGKHTLVCEVRGAAMITTLDGTRIDTREDGTFRDGGFGYRTFGVESATVHRAMVIDPANRRRPLVVAFDQGRAGFSGGTVSGGAYHISGSTEAVYTGEEASLPMLRGGFRARGEVKCARVYASAQGLYELSLNGRKVGDQFLAPGWTDYQRRIQSQTYDITALVKPGANVLGAVLADGWYRGKVGLGWNQVYGGPLALVARIKLTYADGSAEWFSTDAGWRCGRGPFVRADLQDGETYDASREQAGWNAPGFDDSAWSPVEVLPNASRKLVPQPDEPVRALAVLTAKSRTMPAPGRYVYDLGQNMVGVARITMKGRKGQTIILRHAEELYRKGNRKGELYTDNFRGARVTDTYTFAGDGTVTYQPVFTQHGFRYIELSGLDAPPAPEEVKGVVLGSDLPDTGDLQTSHPMLNQLVKNIRWGQRGNFLSIPTDTPARDERLGWTGDISVFAPTAARFQDTRAFLSKWMADLRDAQRSDGNIPAVVPQPRREFDATGVGWSDAFITVPHAVWRATGDTRIVRENWDAMNRFYGFVRDSAMRNGNLLEEGRSSWFSGDWLNLEKVDRLEEHRVIATAYFAEDTRMMAEMAAAIGDVEKAREWAAVVPRIRAAFTEAYRGPDGSIRMGTQTVYAMALGMDMIADPRQRAATATRFVEKLARDDHHLKTGFLGTPWLLPALGGIDRDDLAMRVLLNEDYPSWGFEVRMGATTMWERWNSIRADGDFGPVGMNSFNHYAYGAVADWMFQRLGGLQIVEPGYKKSRIAPLVGGGGLTSARAAIRTPYGPLASEWKIVDGELTLAATVPPNTTAELVFPASGIGAVRGDSGETGKWTGGASFQDGRVLVRLGSGRHVFVTRAPGLRPG
ncbi:rhamnosidase [Luteolibacter sp. LG18]|nr:rhamnosidase [Luteolibacter sp. LG18]